MRLKSYARRLVSQMRVFWVIWRGRRRLSGDPRYRLDLVRTSSSSKQADNDELLRRICAAYRLAMQRQAGAPDAFAASRWWKIVQESNLGPVRRALADEDLDALRNMYRHFFRDPCGAGLVGLPVDMARSYRRSQLQKRYKHLLLIDTLHRLEVWRERTNGRFSIDALRGPEIGAPFGVVIRDVLLRPRAADHHWYAQKMIDLVSVDAARKSACATIAEIGGGFGGLAYYLLRDRPNITYIDFDVPETSALAAYYLGNAFPELQLTLYGERAGNCSGIFLMPAFALAEIPEGSVDAVFSSHVFSDLDACSAREYLNGISRIASTYFFHVDDQAGCQTISSHMAGKFRLAESRAVRWNQGCAVRSNEHEALYVRSGLAEPDAQVSL